jgi:hypothetical protein
MMTICDELDLCLNPACKVSKPFVPRMPRDENSLKHTWSATGINASEFSHFMLEFVHELSGHSDEYTHGAQILSYGYGTKLGGQFTYCTEAITDGTQLKTTTFKKFFCISR